MAPLLSEVAYQTSCFSTEDFLNLNPNPNLQLMSSACCHSSQAQPLPFGPYALLSFFLSLPLHYLSMGHTSFPYNSILQLLISSMVVLYFGFPILKFFWKSIQRLKPDMFTLLGFGILTAYFYSLFGIVFYGSHPPTIFFDAAGAITTLVLAGQWIEQRSGEKLQAALKKLLSHTPSAKPIPYGPYSIYSLFLSIPRQERRLCGGFRRSTSPCGKARGRRL